MLFSTQPSSSAPGKQALKQDMSRPFPPVDSIISSTPSLALSAAPSAVSTLPTKSGFFSKWQPSYYTCSTLTVPSNGQSSNNELLKKNSMLVDQLDGFKQAEQLNQITMYKLVDDIQAKEHECTQLRESVSKLTTNLECCKQDHHERSSAQQEELRKLTVSHDELVNNASTHNAQQNTLQRENNALAHRVAIAEDKVKKYESCTNVLTQQVQAVTLLSTQQQQSSKDRLDAMHAQQLQTEQCADEQLRAKDAVIRDLHEQLKESEISTGKAIISCEDKIVALSVQLERSDLDRKGQEYLANQWQDLSNEHLARVKKLEEQMKQLMDRSA